MAARGRSPTEGPATRPRAKQLRPAQWRVLGRILDRGAIASGCDTEPWTLKRIAHVIERRFGVHYHYISISNGHSRRMGSAGSIRLQATWARRGQTPVVRRLSRRREISSIVVVTPEGRLCARHQTGAVNTSAVLAALPYFRRQVGTPLLVIWDRLNAHRSREVTHFVGAHARDYAVAYLPAYAPELNPEEQANAWVKRRMANALPPSITALATLARRSFRRLQAQPALIRHFFRHAGLYS